MKVAILAESQFDESAYRILLDAIIQNSTQKHYPPLETRGWHQVIEVLPAAIKHLHYRTDVEGLVVVIDSNHTPLDDTSGRSRLLKIEKIISETTSKLKPLSSKNTLRVAYGVACPCIEAWLLCPERTDISEHAWEAGISSGREPYAKSQLKQELHGSSRNIDPIRLIAAARTASEQLSLLNTRFPKGFGTLHNTLRNWM
jgi:hypothetical protein